MRFLSRRASSFEMTEGKCLNLMRVTAEDAKDAHSDTDERIATQHPETSGDAMKWLAGIRLLISYTAGHLG